MKYKVVFLPEAMSDSVDIRQYLSQYYQSTVRKFNVGVNLKYIR